jgi:hypothetical protein
VLLVERADTFRNNATKGARTTGEVVPAPPPRQRAEIGVGVCEVVSGRA